MTYLLSYLLIPTPGRLRTLWWKLSTIITCDRWPARSSPSWFKVFTSTNSATSASGPPPPARAARPQSSFGLIAGNYAAYWLGIAIIALMAIGYAVSTLGGRHHGGPVDRSPSG